MTQTKPSRILGLDYGMARIGVSLSDESKILASPYTTLRAAKKLEDTVSLVQQTIVEIEKERSCVVESVVVGLPLKLSGQHGLMADEVKSFVDALQKKMDITVIPWDERLSSVQADRVMREGGRNRKKRSQVIDVATAVIILQNYLDAQGGSFFP